MSTVPVACADLRRVFGKPGRQGSVAAVDGITHTFASDQLHVITGPSGSGKSTLLHLLAGLDKPTSGSVRLFGEDISRLGERQLSALRQRHMGVVFQRFNLVPTLTAAENITLPARLGGVTVDKAWLTHLAERLGLEGRLDHTPGELSGGQQQRVAVARALLAKPSVVFADEPTGSLDRDSAAHLIGMLRTLADEQAATFVVVTHDRELVEVADDVLHVVDGRSRGTTTRQQPASRAQVPAQVSN